MTTHAPLFLLTGHCSKSLFFALFPLQTDGHKVEDHLKMEMLEEQSEASSFEPQFVMTEKHVKAPSGGTAYLRCRILQLGDRIVSHGLKPISLMSSDQRTCQTKGMINP